MQAGPGVGFSSSAPSIAVFACALRFQNETNPVSHLNRAVVVVGDANPIAGFQIGQRTDAVRGEHDFAIRRGFERHADGWILCGESRPERQRDGCKESDDWFEHVSGFGGLEAGHYGCQVANAMGRRVKARRAGGVEKIPAPPSLQRGVVR